MTGTLDDYVMTLSTELLGIGPDDLSPTIGDALARLCAVLEVDRGYVLKTTSERSAGELFTEWWASGVDQTNTPIADLPMEAQRFWWRSVRSGEVVNVAELDDLEERCPEAAAALRRDGVRSILFVPLLAKDLPVGFVGFETRRSSTVVARPDGVAHPYRGRDARQRGRAVAGRRGARLERPRPRAPQRGARAVQPRPPAVRVDRVARSQAAAHRRAGVPAASRRAGG